MNCTPESSIGFKSNWQLSSLFSRNIHTQMFINTYVRSVLSNSS